MRWERVHGKARAKETPDGRKSAGRKGGIWGPGKRWGHTCNAVRGGRYLYVFGGYGQDNCQTNDVHVFDTAKQTWSKPMIKGAPPSPRDSHTCTTVRSNLFVFGGTDGANPLKDLHILDTSTNTWTSPSVYGKGPDAREGHTAALVDKKLYIFGGCGKSRDDPEEIYYNDLYVLDTDKLVWECAETYGNPPCARDSHTCSSWRNKLIVLGGEDASDYYLSDVYILDTDSLVWTELNTTGQMLAPRAGHCTVALGRNLFVFGGFTDDRNLYDDLHVLSVDTGIWSRVVTVNPGPTARFSAAGDCLDAQCGTLIFIGGCNASLEALDDMYLLHTGMPMENGSSLHRLEKLSIRKEKRNSQENYFLISTPEVNSEVPELATIPISSQTVTKDYSSFVEPSGDRTFEAMITGEVPHGYTLETTIDGKILRGVIFSVHRSPGHESSLSLKKRRVRASTGSVELDDRDNIKDENLGDGHHTATSFGLESTNANGSNNGSTHSLVETLAPGSVELASSATKASI